MFKGLSAFTVTPTDDQGRIDTETLTVLLERIVAAEADSIGLLGSTGAYMFLSRDERRRTVETAVKVVAGRVPVIVGVGTLRTDDAKDLARDAKAAGADGLLLAPVSYVPLNSEEVSRHFRSVAEAGRLPLCIYNNPSTTRFTFDIELIARLSEVENIDAVKMPTPGDSNFAKEIADLRAACRPGFAIGYSGDWGAAEALLASADAWYSVVGGLLPKAAARLTRVALSGNRGEALALDGQFEPMWSLFKEFGSFRVNYAIADILGLARVSPPKPILPLPADVLPRVAKALVGLPR